jgi:curved DNA-binding protein
MAEDLYGVLGVPKGADADTIKKSYRKMAKELHPDKNPGNKKAEERFKTVNHAFDVLSDAKKRALYDEFGEEGLREGFDADRVRAYKQWSQQQGAGGGANGRVGGGGGVRLEDLFGGATTQSEGGFGDLFGDLFGRQGRRAQRGPSPGADLESTVSIDFASAVRGTSLELRPHLPGAVGGTGGESAPVTVRIPQGAQDGSRVRIAGQGAPSPSGGPNGDLLLTIHVEPHPFFRRDGDDLHLDLPITVAEAYKGAKVKVETFAGPVSLKVPPRTQSGAVVRLRGKGVTKKGKTGDLYVHFMVQVPTSDTPDVRDAIEKLAAAQPEDPRKDIRA